MALVDGAPGAAATGGGAQAKKYPIWIGPLAFAIGLALLVVAVLFARSELRYGAEGIAAQATIMRLWVTEGENDDGDTTYSYHVGYEFADPATGGTFRGSSEIGELRYLGLRDGDAIEVSFLASDPAENRLGTPEPQLLLPATIAIFGGLSVVASPLVLVSSLRERRARRMAIAPGSTAGDDSRRVDIFTRSPAKAADGPLAIGFGVGFLTLAAFGVSQAASMPSLLVLTLFGTVVGIGAITAGITALRRGLGLRLAEVGPDGLWLPGLGRVAWADLDEVRIEETRANRRRVEGAQEATSPRPASRRLGVVPRDPAFLLRRPDSLGRLLGRGFFGFLNMLRRDVRLVTESDQAPYGIAASELDQSFDALVASVGRFASVGTRIVEPMGGTMEDVEAPPTRRGEPERPLTDAELLEVDARLERPERSTRFVDGD